MRRLGTNLGAYEYARPVFRTARRTQLRLPPQPPPPPSPSRRPFATVSHDDTPVERLEIPCGSAGTITVDLYNSQALTAPSNPLIIYLPPCGTHLRTHHPSIPPFLFSRYGALASVNYRWNIPSPTPSHVANKPLSSHPSFTTYPFPAPLHDTLHAYTHLTTTLLARFTLPRESPSTPYWSPQNHRQRPRHLPRPILIYGSHLGGTLATSLALTESFTSSNRATRISGLIVKNAILDWTEIATTGEPAAGAAAEQEQPHHPITTNIPWTSSTLHSLKRTLFTHPASCFDPFTSPILFFHSPSTTPPPTWIGDRIHHDPRTPDPLLMDTTISIDSDHDESNAHPELSALWEQDPTIGEEIQAKEGKRVSTLDDVQMVRSSHLKFPPGNSGLGIPRTLFLTSGDGRAGKQKKTTKNKKKKGNGKGKESENDNNNDNLTPTKQAEEMARLMRRSIVLHEFKERTMYDSDFDPGQASEERVQVKEIDMMDAWEEGRREEEEEEERMVREWIEDTLG